MRYLGIDYGEKRIGLSYGDELGIAISLPAAVEDLFEKRLSTIARVIKERKIDELVVGYPYNMDGTVGFKAKEVDRFIEKLEALFHLKVHRTDERLTSCQAENERDVPGAKRKHLSPKQQQAYRRTGQIDSRAAAILLQDFLDANLPAPPPPFEEGTSDEE